MAGSITTLMLVLVGVWLAIQRYSVPVSAEGLLPTAGSPGLPTAVAGPWGKLEAQEIPLANPNPVLPDHSEHLQRPKWFFADFSECRLTRLFNSCDLLPVQRRILLDKHFWNVRSDGCEISPPEALVRSLRSNCRQQIYSVLARSQVNHAQRFAFRFPPREFDALLDESGLSADDITRMRRLAYTNSGTLCFADLQIARDVLSPAEFSGFLGSLCETPAFILRLQVGRHSDIDALAKYWGKGGREQRIKPLLKGLARVPGGGAINIGYLLPPFARLRLFTFPDSWNDATAARQDCFFTSMNFFNETADTNFFDAAYAQKTLDTEYTPVAEDPQYGDVIALLGPEGNAIHMCVYIAGEFVFTKNGVDHAQPWVVMRMSDMLAIYLSPQMSGHMLVFRRKEKV
jgi:hypothetical protein